MSISAAIVAYLHSDWLSILMVLFSVYVALFYHRYFNRENPLPGPMPLPLLGNFLSIGWDLARWANKAQAKYGDVWEVWIGGERSIYLGRADLVEKIYNPSTKNNFTMRTAPSEGLDEFGYSDKGIIMNRGSWQYNRQLVNQSVTSKDYLEEFVSATQKQFIETEGYWAKLGPKRAVDFSAWAMRIVTDVTVLMSTGKPAYQCAVYFNQLSKEKIPHPPSVFESSGDFVNSITTWFYAVQFSYFFPQFVRHYFPVFSYFQTKFMNNSKWLSTILLNIIQKRRQEIRNTPRHTELTPDILTLLLTTNTDRDLKNKSKHVDRPMTDEEIAENLVEVFAAGIDTTANSLTFMIYNLCKHPHVKKRLLQEFDSVFGPGPLDRPITKEDLDKLTYTEAFIKETARVTPVVPALVKTASTDDVVVGLPWKAGTQFYTNVHGIHMHGAHWKNPEKFNPDRFLQDQVQKNSLLQFGGGLRICPGRQMATLELKTLIVMLLRKYDIELKDKNAPLQYSFGMINHCDNLDVYLSPKIQFAGY